MYVKYVSRNSLEKYNFFKHTPPKGKNRIPKKIQTMKNNIKETIIGKVIESLQAETYKVRLVHTDNLKVMRNHHYPNKLYYYTADALQRAVGYLASENMKGYNIYFRPQGYEYILLDDIRKEALQTLAEIKPCLLIETSPENYQVWLRLRAIPKDKQEALTICKYLAEKFNADLGSADPEHVGRLPSYTNRKPQYKLSNGQYPFVKLHRAENRYSTFLYSPKGGVLKEVLKDKKENHAQSPQMLKKEEKEEKKIYTDHDRSRYDFNNVCMWLRQKKTYNQIYELLESTSDKAQSRVGHSRERYLTQTINNAIRVTQITPKQ
jgi:hypothetical protein